MGAKTTAFVIVGVVIVALIVAGIFRPPPTAPEVHDGWFGEGRIRSEDDVSIRPFRVEVPDAVLDDLEERLDNARFPKALEGANFNFGFNSNYLKEVSLVKSFYFFRLFYN